MKAWQIFIHSVRQVFGNFNDALRISGLIFIGQMMVALALGVSPNLGEVAPTPEAAIRAMVAALAYLLGSLWIAVSWHRFVLGRDPGGAFVPPFHGALIWGYFWRSLAIAVIVMLVGMAIGMLAGMVVMPLIGGTWLGGVLMTLLLVVPLLTVMYRFSAILPGVALGQEVSLSDGWAATVGETGTVLQLAAISGVAGVLLGVPYFVLPVGSILTLLWDVAAGWLQLMVGVSILTTLYGHYIEKRPLV